jgi:hypothetical protein
MLTDSEADLYREVRCKPAQLVGDTSQCAMLLTGLGAQLADQSPDA